jgi:hypothetical protein
MNKLRLIISCVALSTMPLLTGCKEALQGGVAGNAGVYVSTPPCSFTLADQKAMYAAEAAYNIPASAYLSANSRGLIKPELKVTLKAKLATMYDYLKGARAAYKICNRDSLMDYKRAIETYEAEISPLIPR